MKEIAIVLFLIAAIFSIPQVKAERLIATEPTYKYIENDDGTIEIDDICYQPTASKENNYYVPCGKLDDKGLNLPNCLILSGKWSVTKNSCLIDGYWFGLDEEDIPTLHKQGLDV